MATLLDPAESGLARIYEAHVEHLLPAGTEWFDAHTHTGTNDPDGMKAAAGDVLAAMDTADHRRALVFPTMEPGGYPDANDRVLDEAAASDGRLVALCRLDPAAEPIAEATRCLDRGAAGLKLHPRAEGFTMHEPAVEQIVELAHARGVPIMIHAGRGIPALGRDTVRLAREYPRARLILAHAGISDLAWIWRDALELPNLFFDTAWWNVADLLALLALVPPSHILYASDTPYGHPLFNGLALLRCAAAVGLDPAVTAELAGGQLARLLDGEEPLDLGPAPGAPTAPAPPSAPRVVQHLAGALSRTMAEADPTEPLALARLACDVPEDDPERPLLAACEGMIAMSESGLPVTLENRRAVIGPAVAAALLAGTPMVSVDGLKCDRAHTSRTLKP